MELIEPEHRQGSNNFSPVNVVIKVEHYVEFSYGPVFSSKNSFPVISAHILQTTTEPMDVELVVFGILACVSDPRPSKSS